MRRPPGVCQESLSQDKQYAEATVDGKAVDGGRQGSASLQSANRTDSSRGELAKSRRNRDGYATFLDENSRDWQRRTRTRACMETAAIFACRKNFLRTGKRRHQRDCRERRDSRQ